MKGINRLKKFAHALRSTSFSTICSHRLDKSECFAREGSQSFEVDNPKRVKILTTNRQSFTEANIPWARGENRGKIQRTYNLRTRRRRAIVKTGLIERRFQLRLNSAPVVQVPGLTRPRFLLTSTTINSRGRNPAPPTPPHRGCNASRLPHVKQAAGSDIALIYTRITIQTRLPRRDPRRYYGNLGEYPLLEKRQHAGNYRTTDDSGQRRVSFLFLSRLLEGIWIIRTYVHTLNCMLIFWCRNQMKLVKLN